MYNVLNYADDSEESFMDMENNNLPEEPTAEPAPAGAQDDVIDLTGPADGEKTELTPEEKKEKSYETFTLLHDLVYMLAIVTVIFVFLVRLVGVDGSSMYPTFVNGDYLVLESNFLYKNVKQGDIVVMTVPYFEEDGPIVKRVIATEGQTVDIDFDSGEVRVDDALLDEPYIFEPTAESFQEFGMGLSYPLTVPEGCVFVMGDNRNHSSDSRFAPVGCVDRSCVLGKVLFLVIPGSQTNEYGEITAARKFGRIGVVK